MSDADELLEYRKQELYDLMSDISEDCYCAGWMSGNEYRLWQAMMDPTDDRRYGKSHIEPKQVNRLRELFEKVNGWWVWGDDGPEFLPVDAWLAKLDKTTGDSDQ